VFILSNAQLGSIVIVQGVIQSRWHFCEQNFEIVVCGVAVVMIL
jgi:hypothetical protein